MYYVEVDALGPLEGFLENASMCLTRIFRMTPLRDEEEDEDRDVEEGEEEEYACAISMPRTIGGGESGGIDLFFSSLLLVVEIFL